MQFVLRGQSFDLTVDSVSHTMAGITPQPFALCAVKIGELWYPQASPSRGHRVTGGGVYHPGCVLGDAPARVSHCADHHIGLITHGSQAAGINCRRIRTRRPY